MENGKSLERIKEFFNRMNYFLDEGILKRFYAAIMTKPRFVILSGPPGTGKTSFALLFAKAWEMVGYGGDGEEGKGEISNVVDINGEKYGIFRYWVYICPNKKCENLQAIRTNNYLVSFEGRGIIRCIDLKTGKSYSRGLNFTDFGITFDSISYVAITYDEKYIFMGFKKSDSEYISFVFKLEDLQEVEKYEDKVDSYWIGIYHIFGPQTFRLIKELKGFKGYEWILDRYLVVWGNVIRVYDMKKGEIVREYETNDSLVKTKLSPDNRYLVLEFKGELKVIDLKKRKEIFLESNVERFKILYDKYLVVLASDYAVIYDLEKNEEIGTFRREGCYKIEKIEFPFFYIHNYKECAIIYDLRKRKPYYLSGEIIDKEGNIIVIKDDKGNYYLFDLETGNNISGNFDNVKLINDKYFLVNPKGGKCTLYYIDRDKKLKKKKEFDIECGKLFISPDKNYVAIIEDSREAKVYLLYLQDLQKIKTTSTGFYYDWRFKINNNGYAATDDIFNWRIVLFKLENGWIEKWSYGYSEQLIDSYGCGHYPYSFGFSPGGRYFWVTDETDDNIYIIILYDTITSQITKLPIIKLYDKIKFDKTERYLCIEFKEDNIKVIDFDDPKKSKEFKANFNSASFISKYFICKGKDKFIILDLETWEEFQYDLRKWKQGILQESDKLTLFDKIENRVIEIPTHIQGEIEDFDFNNIEIEDFRFNNILGLLISENYSLYLSIWDINAKNEIWREEIYMPFDEFYVYSSVITLKRKRADIMKIYIKKLFGFENIADIKPSYKNEVKELKDLHDALIQAQKSDRILLLRVRPEWTNPRDVLGYRNINGQFVKGPIYDFIKRANGDKQNLYFLILDEMNLSHPEYYLSDIISAMETGGKMIIDGEEIEYPENLVIVGTINRDETTQNLSPRLLSRAITLEFRTKWDNDELAKIFKEIDEELKKVGLGIGYREYVRAKEFIKNSMEVGYDEITALDDYINSKIVPRIRGIREDFIKDGENILENIINKCEELGLKKTKESLEKKRKMLESRGIVE